MDLIAPEDFKALSYEIKVGDESGREILLEKLVEGLYNRNDIELKAANSALEEMWWTFPRLCKPSNTG